MSGVCADALNAGGAPSPGEIRAAGADGVRLVALDDDRFFAYAEELLADGLKLAVVLARESFTTADYAGMAAFYSERVWPTYVCLGNEPDAYLLPEPSPSSWSMRPAEYARFWHAAAWTWRSRQPETPLLVAGLVSGQPWWARGLKPLLDPAPDGWDVHPYSKDVDGARELLQAYQDALG